MVTDEQIIKAFESCEGEDGIAPKCSECPISHTEDGQCFTFVRKRLLEIVKRQKAENEALVAGQETLQKNLAKAIKSEAKKEFAEELIYKIVNTPTKFESTYYMYRDGIAFRQNEIIDILKEMVGEVNAG